MQDTKYYYVIVELCIKSYPLKNRRLISNNQNINFKPFINKEVRLNHQTEKVDCDKDEE